MLKMRMSLCELGRPSRRAFGARQDEVIGWRPVPPIRKRS